MRFSLLNDTNMNIYIYIYKRRGRRRWSKSDSDGGNNNIYRAIFRVDFIAYFLLTFFHCRLGISAAGVFRTRHAIILFVISNFIPARKRFRLNQFSEWALNKDARINAIAADSKTFFLSYFHPPSHTDTDTHTHQSHRHHYSIINNIIVDVKSYCIARCCTVAACGDRNASKQASSQSVKPI